jgi:hypothetical protein
MDEIIIEVFGIFSCDYGSLWTTSRSRDLWDMTVKRWSEYLQKFDKKIILLAADRSAKLNKDFPPTKERFFEICKLVEKENALTTVEQKKLESAEIIHSVENLSKMEGKTPVARRELSKIRAILAGKLKMIAPEKEIPHWNKEFVEPTSKTFDQKLYKEREEWLMNISDSDSLTLPIEERFDRLRVISKYSAWHNENAYRDDNIPVAEKTSYKSNLVVLKDARKYRMFKNGEDDILV